jgi:rhodanese-related sulfurtransferase
MAQTYSDMLQNVKGEIRQVTLEEVLRRLEAKESYVLVDVREKDEWRGGFIPGAVHMPRGFLEMQAESKLTDKKARIVVYCAGGIRSAFAARTLMALGYESVESANPGFVRWKDAGFPVDKPVELTAAQLDRYSRHLLLPEVGEKGQKRLLEARVLLLGAGGLGSPAALYLAAAGVGTLGLVDNDTVDASNLQRQILHGTDRVGTAKVDSAEVTLTNLNPDVKILKFKERLPLPLSRAAARTPRAELRRGWCAGDPPRRGGLHPGHRGDQDHPRTRGALGRSPPHLRLPEDAVPHPQAAPRSELPALRRAPRDHLVHRLRGLLRAVTRGLRG